jgi:hypothetical protein
MSGIAVEVKNPSEPIGFNMDESLSFTGDGPSVNLDGLGKWTISPAVTGIGFKQTNPLNGGVIPPFLTRHKSRSWYCTDLPPITGGFKTRILSFMTEFSDLVLQTH